LIWTLSGMWNAHKLGKKIPKYLILISLNDFYPVFCLHFCFLIEKMTKGKKPPLSLLEHIFMGRQSFWINTENVCKRGYLFWCILHTMYIETSGPTLEKKCCLIRNLTYSLEWNAQKQVCKLVRLEYMQIFPAGRQRVLYEFFGRSALCDPRTLNLYHSMFSCNFATLAILDVCVCNMCATKANKKAYVSEISATLRGRNPACFNSL